MGNYAQTHLVVGVYEVRVEAPGFETAVQQNVAVEVDAVTQVNVALNIGKVGEVVNVTGEAPLLKTEKSDVSLRHGDSESGGGAACVFARYEPALLFSARLSGERHNGRKRAAARYLPAECGRAILGWYFVPIGWNRQPRFSAGRAGDYAESGRRL